MCSVSDQKILNMLLLKSAKRVLQSGVCISGCQSKDLSMDPQRIRLLTFSATCMEFHCVMYKYAILNHLCRVSGRTDDTTKQPEIQETEYRDGS